jgi:hypothetical protein
MQNDIKMKARKIFSFAGFFSAKSLEALEALETLGSFALSFEL